MTEDQIELIIERKTNKLDRMLMNGLIDQETYDYEVYKLDLWGEQQYRDLCRS